MTTEGTVDSEENRSAALVPKKTSGKKEEKCPEKAGNSVTPEFLAGGGLYQVGRLTFLGHVLPCRRSVLYLPITLDHHLSWKPAVGSHRLSSHRVAGAASPLLARGKGCSSDTALRMYNAVAGARALYAFSMVALSTSQ
ncbi:hypothetical protein MRX96_036324 [Rhipicephalus microplus]